MKAKRIILLLLVALSVACFAFSLSACKNGTSSGSGSSSGSSSGGSNSGSSSNSTGGGTQTCVHEWQTLRVITPATCEGVGTEEQKCTKCEQTKEVEISALGHDFAEEWTTSDGKHYHACKNAGCTAKDSEAAHSFGAWVNEKPATCKATGVKGYKDCSVCNKHYDNDGNEIEDLTIAIDPSAHNYVNDVCTHCDTKNPSTVFYLVGQINGEDCGVESDFENTGDYEFDDDGKVTVSFTADSYVLVKRGDNSVFYMLSGDLAQGASYTYLYPSEELGSDAKMLFVPANTKATFAIDESNNKGSLLISFTFGCLVHNLTEHVAKAATCTETGNVAYWTCSGCTGYFANAEGSALIADANKDGKITLSDTVIEKAAHSYGEVSYAWDDDKYECTATRSCSVCTEEVDGHTQTAFANVTDSITQNATCVLVELSTKTATFDETWAETQTVTDVQTDNALGHIDENRDHVCDRTGCTEAMGTHAAAENSHYCDYCLQKVSDHSGGTATCQQKATCTVCGDEYGEFDSTNHEKDWKWIKNDTMHWSVYECCSAYPVEEEDHEWENGVCTECEYVCEHFGGTATCKTQATCTVCGDDYGEFVSTSHEKDCVWTKTATTHKYAYECCGMINIDVQEHAWENGVCTECEYVCEHTGGTATCQQKATCTVCGDDYGDFAAHDFEETTWVQTKTSHYHSCKTTGCTQKQGEAEHTYNTEGICTVCSFDKNVLATEGLTYSYNAETQTYTVTGYTGTKTVVYIPETYDDGVNGEKAVTSIGQDAFKNKTAITGVVIPNTVTYIGAMAFDGCSALSNISIPNSVTEIGNWVFDGCSAEAYTEYGNVYYLGNEDNPYLILEKVKDTSITSCDIPTGTKFIQRCAFKYCTSLSTVTIPNGVEAIMYQAFYGCNKLTSVTIPNSVKKIGNEAFYNNTSLTQVTIGSGVKEIANNAFRSCGSLNRVDISDVAAWLNISFSNAESNPLYYAKNLYLNNALVEDLVIPNGITEIKQFAFYNATCLKTVTLPASITSIGASPFDGCSNLNGLYITDIVAWVNINVGTANQLLFYAKNLYLNGTLVEDLVIPENKGVTEIKRYAFHGATCLKSVTIPEGVTTIGESAFRQCYNLQTVNIPNSLTTIGSEAFYFCNAMQTVTYDNAKYLGNTNNPYLVLYEAANIEITSCTIHADTKIILSDAFSGCSNLAEITIPGKVTDIQSDAFRRCSNLQSIAIPDDVKSLGANAFAYCTKLTSVTFGSGLTSMGNGVFKNCTELQSITLPDSITEIPYNTFEGCTKLTSVTFGKNVTAVGGSAFKGCTALTSIVIPDTVTVINANAFYGCTELSSITLSKNLTYINDSAFEGCVKLSEVVMPESLKRINAAAFCGCTSLKTVTMRGGITFIGVNAFKGCTSLTAVNFSGTKAQWSGIVKANSWDTDTGEYIVVYTDGTI